MASGMLEIILYTKENCSLCLKAKRVLLEVQKRIPLRIIEADITRNEEWHERYKHDIPVAVLNGKELFRHRIEVRTLETLLQERIDSLCNQPS